MDPFYDVMMEAGLRGIVAGVIRKQFRLSEDYLEFPHLMLGRDLPIEYYKPIRRGVRWTMTHAGFEHQISDDKLVQILHRLGFEKVEVK